MSARNGHRRAMWMPRSRGAVPGLLLMILGAWGALIPFVGPHFNFAYTPGREWAWSTARAVLEVLPGVAALLGGLVLILSGSRVTAMLGSWLAILAGIWFVIGRAVAPVFGIGSVGEPIGATSLKRAVLEIAYFSGLGTLIVFVGAVALTRLASRLAIDVEALERVNAAREEREAREAKPSTLYREPSYFSGLEEASHDQSSDALAKPRHAEGAGTGRRAAYLRWPHPTH